MIEETGERVTCLLNPESVVMRRVAGIRPRRSIGGSLSGTELADDAMLFTGGGMTEMFLNLLFDVALTDPAASLKVEDVRSMTSPLWKLAENSGEPRNYGEPPRVRFVWGKSWNIPGVVASVSEHLDYFDQTGTPLRSWLRMRFLRVVEPLMETTAKAPPLPLANAIAAQPTPTTTATTSEVPLPQPPATETPSREVKIHSYAAGERLDQLVRQQYGFYGHPSLWRLIASYNGISDPLNIPAGTILQFPPLSVLENKQ